MRMDSPQNDARGSVPHVRRWFFLAACLVVLWAIGLGVLSIVAANPVTLNRDQILESVDVLTAVVEDRDAGHVRVEKSWKDSLREEHLTLSELREMKLATNERLLIPVTRAPRSARHRWQITPSKLPHDRLLVYPATEESQRQLDHLLKTGRLP